MPYFTEEHVRIALQRLPDSTHPALITFLAMLRSGIPMDDAAQMVPYGADQENKILRDYFSPPGGTAERPFYVPFGRRTKGHPRWKTNDYSGTSLQRIRTGEYSGKIYRRDGTRYAVRADVAAILANARIAQRTIGNPPLSAHLLAAWLYRKTEIASHTSAIKMFADEFKIGMLGAGQRVFSLVEDPQLSLVPLGDRALTDQEIGALVEPPDLPEDEAARVRASDEAESESEEGASLSVGSWEIGLSALESSIADLKGVRAAAVQALAALRAGMHVVFVGPPGSGKTELAKRVCKAAGFDPWLVTATDAWTTFETIGGYFPQFDGEKERLDFEPGVVVASMQQGKILIIDEINRADIDKAFGELFTLLAGSDVDLAHRRRTGAGSGGQRIRLVTGDGIPPPDVEAVHMPAWWRIVGAMNDADKASLKRLSFAFVRRFAFVPVGLPESADYAALIDTAAAATGLTPARAQFVDSLKAIFAAPTGLMSFGMAMGFAIPKTMISQAVSELGVDGARTDGQLLASAMELYLAPQFQGWAEKHEPLIILARAHLTGEDLKRFERGLANWTGFVA